MPEPAPPNLALPENELWKDYEPPASAYDEAFTPGSEARPAWQRYLGHVGELGAAEIDKRWLHTKQFIRENGIVYNVLSDDDVDGKLWEVDPIPHLISAEDWRLIEAAVIQRAKLLDHVLSDLYGQQMLLRNGLLPGDVVFAHPGFLRPCHGMRLPGNRHLHFYAVDLGRSPDGQWWFLADRTQAPSGTGYALENRVILSRAFPEVFHEIRVKRIISFFTEVRESLRQLAPHEKENPLIVLLTPGPYHDRYFEHAYLSRHLGYPLVEGADLTVRDNCVFVKTLSGLQRVDVIVRRVSDKHCDPLELRYDSGIGVPGLVQSARAGNVSIVNALGSGIAGSYAMMAFLPQLSRAVLREELLIPSVPTWWCGEPGSLEHVISNLDRLVVKTAFPTTGNETHFGHALSKEELAKLKARIIASPAEYIGQERIELSTTPAWENGKLAPRRLTIRLYAAATPDGFRVMPGGLGRVSAEPNGLSVSMQKGGASKDVWILSDGPVAPLNTMQHVARMVRLSRKTIDQPSRVADNLFWLGRYVERADATARLLRSILTRLTGEADTSSIVELPALVRALATREVLSPELAAIQIDKNSGRFEKEILSAVYDTENAVSLRSTLTYLRRTSWIVRDRLSNDTWRILRRLDSDFQRNVPNAGVPLADELSLMNDLIITLAAFGGLAMESMTRGLSWRFLDIGRRVERAIFLIDLLQTTIAQSSDNDLAVMQAVLEVADSAMTYRSRYLSTILPAPLLDLLIADETNPRALAFQLAALNDHVDALPRDRTVMLSGPEQRFLPTLITRVKLADMEVLAAVDDGGVRRELAALLTDMHARIPQFSDVISRNYFSHTESVKSIGDEGERTDGS